MQTDLPQTGEGLHGEHFNDLPTTYDQGSLAAFTEKISPDNVSQKAEFNRMFGGNCEPTK